MSLIVLVRRYGAAVLLGIAGVAFADDIVPPRLTHSEPVSLPHPSVPPQQDHVLVELTIDERGRVSDARVIESAGAEYDTAVLGTVQRWLFEPATHQGVATAVRTRLSFRTVHQHGASLPDAGSGSLPAAATAVGASAGTPTEGAGNGAGAFPGSGNALESVDAGTAGSSSPPMSSAIGMTDTVEPVESSLALDGGHQHILSTVVTGQAVPRSRGASDFLVEVGELQAVPRRSSAELLKLAPGVLLTNEGGDGHPHQIFLRGFDAREGQDLEVTVAGVPVNEAGHLHGNGYVDLNFVIPEVVDSLRVIEGPFDPRQGNFAVAGSAAYQLGLAKRGLTASASVGQFGTQRLALMWGPSAGPAGTFAAAQLSRTAGFGQNRDAISGAVMSQFEGALSEETTFTLGATAYTAQFHSAGLLREQDVRNGLVGFFDSYDVRQGGDSTRVSFTGELRHHHGSLNQQHQVFFVYRGSRLMENFTGFLHDVQLAQQNPHGQRGDLLDRSVTSATFGGKGAGKYRGTVGGQSQELELGYFARVDLSQGSQYRIESGGNVPYLNDADLASRLGDIGLYGDANVSVFDWLKLRGGLRMDVFTFNVLDNCAVKEVRRPSAANPPGDQSCLNQRDLGRYREPIERVTAFGVATMPRGTLLLGPWAGVTLTGSYGFGVRSIDPQFVSQDLQTPFATIHAWEGGAQWEMNREPLRLSARGVVFGTRVDRDLVFSEQAGRSIIGGSTSRLGALVAGRARGNFFDVSANVTWVQSKFDDSQLLVPYVPDLVARVDGAAFHELPWRVGGQVVRATGALGMSYVGRRALPFSERSDVIFVVDASAEFTWHGLSVGVSATNLFDARYRLSEFNYPADFRVAGGSQFPSLVPSRLFSAGAPRIVLATLGFHWGGAE